MKSNYYFYLFIFGLLVFTLSNQYFGWNKEAQSGAERVCDFFSCVGLYGGLAGMFVQSIVRDVFFNQIEFFMEFKDEQ